jgi:hypothetical protein
VIGGPEKDVFRPRVWVAKLPPGQNAWPTLVGYGKFYQVEVGVGLGRTLQVEGINSMHKGTEAQNSLASERAGNETAQ